MTTRHQPGLHREVPEAVYRADPAISQSDLKALNQHCPAKARHMKLNPKEQTPAMAFGSMLHPCVLEPDLFEKEWVARPPGMERRSNKGKAAWAAFEEKHKGKGICTQEDWDKACAMRDAVWAHPTASAILSVRQMTEVSAFWEDPETGLHLKGRLDAIAQLELTAVIDLKTCADASPRAMERQSANLGYHFQAAAYLEGLNVLSPRERMFVLICVEKEPPHLVACYEFDWASLDAGQRAFRSAVLTWAECEKTGHWPGYEDGIATLELPRWAVSQVEEETF